MGKGVLIIGNLGGSMCIGVPIGNLGSGNLGGSMANLL